MVAPVTLPSALEVGKLLFEVISVDGWLPALVTGKGCRLLVMLWPPLPWLGWEVPPSLSATCIMFPYLSCDE